MGKAPKPLTLREQRQLEKLMSASYALVRRRAMRDEALNRAIELARERLHSHQYPDSAVFEQMMLDYQEEYDQLHAEWCEKNEED